MSTDKLVLEAVSLDAEMRALGAVVALDDGGEEHDAECFRLALMRGDADFAIAATILLTLVSSAPPDVRLAYLSRVRRCSAALLLRSAELFERDGPQRERSAEPFVS